MICIHRHCQPFWEPVIKEHTFEISKITLDILPVYCPRKIVLM